MSVREDARSRTIGTEVSSFLRAALCFLDLRYLPLASATSEEGNRISLKGMLRFKEPWKPTGGKVSVENFFIRSFCWCASVCRKQHEIQNSEYNSEKVTLGRRLESNLVVRMLQIYLGNVLSVDHKQSIDLRLIFDQDDDWNPHLSLFVGGIERWVFAGGQNPLFRPTGICEEESGRHTLRAHPAGILQYPTNSLHINIPIPSETI